MIAVILIRGMIDSRQTVKDTLFMLKLRKKHSCVLLDDTPVNNGMLQKVKDFVAYGPVSKETEETFKKIAKDGVAHLHPPRKGFKSIKRSWKAGGDLGLREDMDALMGRMLP